MKKLLLDLHLYLGLLCAGYLIIYGISTLTFNHDWQPTATDLRWSRSVTVADIPDNAVLAAAVRDSLGLNGWLPPWQMHRQENGAFAFMADRPAKSYHITYDPQTATAQIKETRRGWLGAVRWLHGFTGLKDAPWTWATSWAIYTELSIWALTLSTVSGLYLWWQRPAARRQGWWLVGLGSGGSLLLMFYIVW